MSWWNYDELKDALLTKLQNDGEACFHKEELELILGADKLINKLGALAVTTRSTYQIEGKDRVIFRVSTY